MKQAEIETILRRFLFRPIGGGHAEQGLEPVYVMQEFQIAECAAAIVKAGAKCFSCGRYATENCPRPSDKLCGREHEGGTRAASDANASSMEKT